MAGDLAQFLSGVAYEGVEFPLMAIKTSWGHDKVAHRANKRPGSDTSTTGMRERIVTCTAAFLNDLQGWPNNMFPARLRQLLQKFREVPKGAFDHPFHGRLNVHVDEVDEPIESAVQNGVFLQFTLSEYDEAAAEISDPEDRRASDPATEMVRESAATDAAVADAIPDASSRPPAIAGLVLGHLAFLEGGPAPSTQATPSATQSTSSAVRPGGAARGFIEASAAFASLQASFGEVLAHPGLQGVVGHDARVAAEATRFATMLYAERYLSDGRPSAYLVRRTMSLGSIAALVYGDSTLTTLLRAANQIPDEVFVPAGTVLRVLPH